MDLCKTSVCDYAATMEKSAPTTTYTATRIGAVDIVRGLAMILMALDHTRDFLGTGVNPVDIATTTAPLFFTRWITHFCAPTFFLLTGTSAWLSRRGRPASQLSWHLLTRGAWLLLLELTVFRFVLQFNFDYHTTLLNVLWALGWALVVLSALVYLPRPAITAFGIILVAGHNALDSIRSANPLWTLLHSPNFVLKTPEHAVLAGYPLIPWVGVTALGYCLGVVYDWTTERRKRFLLRMGLALVIAFIAIRAVNIYGDPVPWVASRPVISFLNTNKYPPSLLFLLMTLGPALLLLRAVDGRTGPVLRVFSTYGKVPLFYFLVHFALIHLIATVVCYARFGEAHGMFESPSIAQFPFTAPPGWGFSLPLVYLFWAIVVCCLYPLCCWYAGIKQTRRHPLLSYL
jgi:uncharacterized membrane protein